VGEWVVDDATGRQGTVISVSQSADSLLVEAPDGTTWTQPLSDSVALDGDIPEADDDDEPLGWITDLD
jgi:hypothetical protein